MSLHFRVAVLWEERAEEERGIGFPIESLDEDVVVLAMAIKRRRNIDQ